MDSHTQPMSDAADDSIHELIPLDLAPTATCGGDSAPSACRNPRPPEAASHASDAPERQRAWRYLFRRETLQSVRRWLRKLGVAEQDCHDVAQVVMVQALYAFPGYSPERGRPERWLNSIAVHVALHHEEKTRRRRARATPTERARELVDDRPSAEAALCAEEARRRLLVALCEIQPDLGRILCAHDLDEIPMKDVARAMGIPLSTAYKRRTSALSALKTGVTRLMTNQRHG
jgi:RNA polymerase sigma-70 factor, ECF subfamily